MTTNTPTNNHPAARIPRSVPTRSQWRAYQEGYSDATDATRTNPYPADTDAAYYWQLGNDTAKGFPSADAAR